MDMATTFQDQAVFHMTGRLTGDGLLPVEGAGLLPAPMAAYRDPSGLRHDFPLVLDDADGAVSLTDAVDRTLAAIAPRGIDGERLRRHVLRLEHAVRARVADGEEGTLSSLWAQAAEVPSDDPAAQAALPAAARTLGLDGELAACDDRLPARLLTHVWRDLQRGKAARFHARADHLIRRLSDIERAAWLNSKAGRQPEALQAAVGAPHADVFDFTVLSRLVARGVPADELPAARRRRIDWALDVLRAQAFHADPKDPGRAVFGFAFDDCASAMEAYRARLPRLVELVKAIAVAGLEADGAYVEARHDLIFERFGAESLTAGDLALFPDYLVCIPPDGNEAPRNADLLQMLSSGLPVKVLVQLTDLLEEASIGVGHFAFGVRSARLATTAMGLGGMFVLQSTSSNLYALRDRVRHGLGCAGPALFCVFAGSPEDTTGLPRQLSAAAAMESRTFAAFSYDAAAGSNWADRFCLENNRDLQADWPVDRFEYADEALQRAHEALAFTYADFVLCDRRHARHFAIVPRERWNVAMLPAADWLALPEADAAEHVPYLLAVDADDRLHRVIVDAMLMHATRRCLLLWHRLQEHGGVNNSHAERLLAREKAAWEAKKQALQEPAAEPATAPAAAAMQPPALQPTDDEAPAAPPSDDPWIETARCPSCNECQLINDKLFLYNENKQAYLGDLSAGTYRQLVEAAESCQVAIIHPGKPRDPNEPGLEELIERAKPFL